MNGPWKHVECKWPSTSNCKRWQPIEITRRASINNQCTSLGVQRLPLIVDCCSPCLFKLGFNICICWLVAICIRRFSMLRLFPMGVVGFQCFLGDVHCLFDWFCFVNGSLPAGFNWFSFSFRTSNLIVQQHTEKPISTFVHVCFAVCLFGVVLSLPTAAFHLIGVPQ